MPPQQASAQGFFERLFGGFHRQGQQQEQQQPQLPSSQMRSFAPFGNFFERIRPEPRDTSGPVTFCVRTCDGKFFRVHNQPGLSAAEACHAFCPASKTQLYSGNGIDHATASNGGSYSDLATAFLYRKQLVAGCTCNGHDVFGLAHVDVKTDPTLKPGDVVATRQGMVAFTGTKNHVADFTPVESYPRLPKSARDRIADMKIMRNTPVVNATPLPLRDDRSRRDDDNQTARR